MNGNPIDTLRLANRLKAAGFEALGAEGMARALCDELEGRVVTKSDLETALERTETRLGTAIAGVDGKVEALRHELDGKIAGVDGRVEALRHELDAKIAGLDGKVESLRQEMDARFASVDGRVAALDTKVSALDAKIDDRVSALDAKIDDKAAALDAKMDLTAASLDKRLEHNTRWMIFVAGILFAAVLAGGAPQYVRMFGVGQPAPPASAPAMSEIQERDTPTATTPATDPKIGGQH